MFKLRWKAISLIAVLLTLTGHFWIKVIGLLLTVVLGINSPGSWAIGYQVQAAPPPIDIFDNSPPNSSNDPPIDIFAPQIPTPNNNPPPNQDNPSSLTGVWLYSVYSSPSEANLIYRNDINVVQEGNKIISNLCNGTCIKYFPLANQVEHPLGTDAVKITYDDLVIETVASLDNKAIWTEVKDLSNSATLYLELIKFSHPNQFLKNSKPSFNPSDPFGSEPLAEYSSKPPVKVDTWAGMRQPIDNTQIKVDNQWSKIWQGLKDVASKSSEIGAKNIKNISSTTQQVIQKFNSLKIKPLTSSQMTQIAKAIGQGAKFTSQLARGIGAGIIAGIGALGTAEFLLIIGSVLVGSILLFVLWCTSNPMECENLFDYLRDLKDGVEYAFGSIIGRVSNLGMQSFYWHPDSRLLADNLDYKQLAQEIDIEYQSYVKKLKDKPEKISQFPLPIPRIPGAGGVITNIVIGQIVRLLAGFLKTESPFSTSLEDVYPTVKQLPGKSFDPSPETLAVFSQALRQANGKPRINLPSGDYELPGGVFCYKPRSYGAQSQAGYPLAPIKGKQAEPLILLNSRYPLSGISKSEVQTLSWNILLGVKYEDMTPNIQGVVDKIIPEYRQQLSRDFLESIQEKWQQIAKTIPGLPGIGEVMSKLPGEVGQIMRTFIEGREAITRYGDNYAGLQQAFVFDGRSPEDQANNKFPPGIWSKLSDRVYARMLPTGFGGPAKMQIRVFDNKGQVLNPQPIPEPIPETTPPNPPMNPSPPNIPNNNPPSNNPPLLW